MRTALTATHILLPALLGPALAAPLAVAWRLPWFWPGLAALVCGTIAVYTGDRVVERGDQLRPRLRIVMAAIGALSAIVTAALALLFSERLLEPLLYLGLLAIAYPAIKRIPLAKALAVGIGWMLAVCTLPLTSGEVPWHLLIQPAALAVCGLIAAGSILCDFKDQLTDRQAHIPSIPVWLGEAWALRVVRGLCLYAAILATVDRAMALWLPAGALLMLTLYVEWLRRILWGPILVDLALCTGALVAALQL